MFNKNFYNTILSQTFSHCGNYLFTGDIYGQIAVFHLSKVINPDETVTKSDQSPINIFDVEDDVHINSLLTTENFLIVGCTEGILGYDWKIIHSKKTDKPTWKIELPKSRNIIEKVDINCMVLSDNSELIYVGCSDNNIHCVNIEASSIVRTFKGHTEYIHDVFKHGNELISGGEDGVVNVWDLREKDIICYLEPWKNENVERNDLGKWIGAVSMNDDWFICGGGPRLSLWHIRSLTNSVVFPVKDKGIHVAELYEDQIFASGSSDFFYNMNLMGEITAEIPVSCVTVYSAIHQENPYKVLSIAGSGYEIDISTNYTYRDQILSFV